MEKYIIGKFENNGIFNCVEIIVDNELMLKGRFENYKYKKSSDFHQFYKENNNTLILN